MLEMQTAPKAGQGQERRLRNPTAGQGGQNVTELRKFDMTDDNVPPTDGEGKAEPVVFADGTIVRANSMDVGEFFGKRHNDVMRTIRDLIEAAEGEHARKIALMFRPTAREVAIGNGAKRLDPCYDMNRDGFTLLAMGFTGAKALRFKLLYIEAFNAMEELLHSGGSSSTSPLSGAPAAPESIKMQPIQVQLRWLDCIANLYGDEVAREGYRETSLPMLPGILRRPQQGDLFRDGRQGAGKGGDTSVTPSGNHQPAE